MIEKIRECFDSLELPFQEEVIDRVYRAGKEYTDKISKKNVKSITAIFKSWEAGQQPYNGRPRVQKDGKQKPFQNFSISVDLTRRRCQLLSEARGIVKDVSQCN